MKCTLKDSIFRGCMSILFVANVPVAVLAADVQFKPTIALSEEVTDNIFEKPTNKRSEYITRLSPGATLQYSSPLWTWDTTYGFEYRTYARNSRNTEYNHTAALKGNIAVVDKFLFLDLSDTYRRVTLDVSRTAVTESSLFLNQTDQNIATISPYLLWRLRGDNTLKTGYVFTDTRYWDATSIEKQEHRGFADVTHELSSKLSLTGGYAFTRLESIPSQFDKHDLSGGFKYEYADKSFVSAQVGNSWQHFNSGIDVTYIFWNAAVTHDFRGAVVTFETRSATTEDPRAVSTRETTYSGKLEKTLQRGSMGLSSTYSEFLNTATNRLNSRRLGFTASGRYEVLQNLTANLGATADRFSKRSAGGYPYRFSATGGLSYALKNELTLGLTYTYVTNLVDLDTTTRAKDINTVIVEIKKAF